MNNEQIAKAQAIIELKNCEATFKALKLHEHIKNCERVKIFNLPYKIIKALENPLTEWYPGTEAPKDMTPWFVSHFNNIDWDSTAYYKDYLSLLETIAQSKYDDNGNKILSFDLKPEYEQIKLDYEAKYRLWDWYTDKGKAKRWYYMAHFLKGYDIENFTPFDFFGDLTHTPQEVKAFKLECIRIQIDYESNPQNYYMEVLSND